MKIISQASCRLPKDLKKRYPHISWQDIAGGRNVGHHDYEEVLADYL
ncbi:MAG: HepT-like ribonuclease domain-containing protein [Cyanobacteria bacterium P01_G01_bin.49]